MNKKRIPALPGSIYDKAERLGIGTIEITFFTNNSAWDFEIVLICCGQSILNDEIVRFYDEVYNWAKNVYSENPRPAFPEVEQREITCKIRFLLKDSRVEYIPYEYRSVPLSTQSFVLGVQE